MRVAPAKTLVMGDMESTPAISSNQARLPVEGLGDQPSHKTFELQFVLPAGCAGVKVAQELWKWPTSDWSSLRPMPHHKREPIPDTA